ncbi:MAG: preprotein translocase subunit SecE [Candidatus Ornithomonoglobus sp.]
MAESNVKVKKKPFFARMKKYFKDTKSELKKVTWPTKEQLKQNTTVIVVFIILIGIFLAVFDVIFSLAASLLTNIL